MLGKQEKTTIGLQGDVSEDQSVKILSLICFHPIQFSRPLFSLVCRMPYNAFHLLFCRIIHLRFPNPLLL